MALVGEVLCQCGATVLARDGSCNENDRKQVICLACGIRYDKGKAEKARQENATIVMSRCLKCREWMVRVFGNGGQLMKCPECGKERPFEKGR